MALPLAAASVRTTSSLFAAVLAAAHFAACATAANGAGTPANGAATAATASAAAPTAPAADPSPKPPPTALQALNKIARADYAQARTRLLQHAGPILLVTDKLSLLRGERREEASLTPPGFDELKAIAHAPLGLHALFVDGDPEPARLEELRAAIRRVLAELPSLPLTEAQRQRQVRLLEASLRLSSHAELPAFEKEVAPLLLDNAREAARAQVDLLHEGVKRFRDLLGTDLDRVHVVIIAAHMPRQGLLALAYFERLLHEREGGRIVYAEEKWAEKDALSLLGTHLIDASIGQGFFGEPLRMHRDLLADDAAVRIREILP